MRLHDCVESARLGQNPTVIRRLPSGWVVLGDNQTIPGYTLLLSDPAATDLNELSLGQRAAFLRDMTLVGDALVHATGAYLINYSILGNADHALHAHIHPRYENEPEEKRRTGHWAYFPPHPQTPFDLQRDRSLMVRIGKALDEVCISAGITPNPTRFAPEAEKAEKGEAEKRTRFNWR